MFRTAFLGKASPVHFFWGSFDLAVTRFSGRRRRSSGRRSRSSRCGDARGLFARGHQRGFWPGGDAFPQAAFYSYAYPAPAGFFEAAEASPRALVWLAAMGEWLLPYEAVLGAPPIPTPPS